MSKIIGNTTTTPMAIPDWNQTDETKADYIKNKPIVLSESEVIDIVKNNGGGGSTLSSSIENNIFILKSTGSTYETKVENNTLVLLKGGSSI